MSFTRTQEQITRHIDGALGIEPADIVIKNVTLLNIISENHQVTDIAIKDEMIVGTYGSYKGVLELDATGLTAVPGFIDAHVHTESSMITPPEFAKYVLLRGTTTAVCDPHEMSNVLGLAALKYFLQCSENMPLDLFVNLSSCVPATKLETSGARLNAHDLHSLISHPRVIGLAELMDIGGVLGKDPDVIEKVRLFDDQHIDGHLPGILGNALNAMLTTGVSTCHESVRLDEAEEKLDKAVRVLIREGTVCKDMEALHPLIKPLQAAHLAFCTDDRNPLEIAREGHIDHLIRSAIKHRINATLVYRVASLSAAQAFGLDKNTSKWRRRGVIAPGWLADIVLLSSVKDCRVESVIKSGKPVTPDLFKRYHSVPPIGYNSIQVREMTAADFEIRAAAGTENVLQDVIGYKTGQIVTDHLSLPLAVKDGIIQRDLGKDVIKIAVIERHGKNGNIGIAFIKGFGLKSGAIASSVGHDSHNITVIGVTNEDMAAAVNAVRANQGGYAVVQNGAILGSLPLPVAGLMSEKPFHEMATQIEALREKTKILGSPVEDVAMALAFMPLCVIPALKVTDYGLVRFKPAEGDQGPVLIDDQRNQRPNALPITPQTSKLLSSPSP